MAVDPATRDEVVAPVVQPPTAAPPDRDPQRPPPPPPRPGRPVMRAGGVAIALGFISAAGGGVALLSASPCIGPCIGGGSGSNDASAAHVLLAVGGATVVVGLILIIIGIVINQFATVAPTIGTTVNGDGVLLGASGVF